MPAHDKIAETLRIEEIERGDADADALSAAWRGAKTLQLNLRTRMRRAVARSASLPPGIAPDVIQRFPEDLLANPALPLLLLDLPNLLQRAPRRFWDAVLAAPEISPALLPALVAGCPHHRLGHLARRPEFEPADAPAMLQRLRRDGYGPDPIDLGLTDAQCLALCRQWHEPMLDLDAETLRALRALTSDPTVRLMLMRARQLTFAEAVGLIPTAMARQYTESLALAVREDLPGEVRDEMLTRESGPVRALICANPSTPPEVLARCATDRNPMVSTAAILNPRLPREGYVRLLTRGTATRRTAVAARPNLSTEDFNALALAGEAQVRLAVAQNPTAPPEVLARLGRDLVDEVREAAVVNPRYVPEAIAPQEDTPTPEKPTRRAKSAKPSMIDLARTLLVGDTSGGARWEPALRWAAEGGARPERVPMGAQDRRKVLRAGLKVLGEDVSTADPVRDRLLAVLVEGLGALPELSARELNKIPSASPAVRDAVAEQWMTALQRAGYTEAEALALLCSTRTSARLGRGPAYPQRSLAQAALGPRRDRAVALLRALPKGKSRDHFAQDLADLIGGVEMPSGEACRWLVAFYADNLVRGALEPEALRRMVTLGKLDFVKTLEAHDAALARSFLRELDLRYAWQIPPEVMAMAQAARGIKNAP